MDRIFRVVLEQPTKSKKWQGGFRLRFGSSPAQRMPGYSTADYGDIGRNGAAAGIRSTQVQERPGKAIWFPAESGPPLKAGDPELDHVDNVPEDAVKLNFGDFDYPEENVYNDIRMTKGMEKTRIEQMYGDKKNEMRRVGKNYADVWIGPPDVPHVACYEMDARGNTTGFVYRPWDHFGWKTEAYETVGDQTASIQEPVTSVTASQLFELQKQIAVLQAQIEIEKPKRGRPKKEAEHGVQEQSQVAAKPSVAGG